MGLPPDLAEAAAEAAPAAAPTVAEAVAAEVAADAAAPAPCGVPGVSPWLPLGACASQPCDLNLPLERTPLRVERVARLLGTGMSARLQEPKKRGTINPGMSLK